MLAINMCEHVTAYGFYLPYEDSSYHDPQPSWEYKKWDFDFSAGFASTMKEGDHDTSNRAHLPFAAGLCMSSRECTAGPSLGGNSGMLSQ